MVPFLFVAVVLGVLFLVLLSVFVGSARVAVVVCFVVGCLCIVPGLGLADLKAANGGN